MMFSASSFSGAEAATIGLANLCVADEDFEAELHKLSAMMLANSWFSHRANKRLLRQTEGMTLAAGLSHEIHRSEGRGPDMQDRIAAFMGKGGEKR
ncbi:MAG: enoyl-CoA hydratase/isomerase family protein [Quisquiliibacterium sp.]